MARFTRLEILKPSQSLQTLMVRREHDGLHQIGQIRAGGKEGQLKDFRDFMEMSELADIFILSVRL